IGYTFGSLNTITSDRQVLTVAVDADSQLSLDLAARALTGGGTGAALSALLGVFFASPVTGGRVASSSSSARASQIRLISTTFAAGHRLVVTFRQRRRQHAGADALDALKVGHLSGRRLRVDRVRDAHVRPDNQIDPDVPAAAQLHVELLLVERVLRAEEVEELEHVLHLAVAVDLLVAGLDLLLQILLLNRIYHRFRYEIAEAHLLLDVVEMLLPVVRGIASVFVVVPDAEAAQLHRNLRIDVRHVRLDVVLLDLIEVEVARCTVLLVQLLQVLRDVADAQLRLPHAIAVPNRHRVARLLLQALRDRALVHVRAVRIAAARVEDVGHHLQHRRVRWHPEDLFGKHVAQPEGIALRIRFLPRRHVLHDLMDDLPDIVRLIEAYRPEAMIGQIDVQRIMARVLWCCKENTKKGGKII
uniref:Uncharacterized protein n=1 Tax=Anopheles atroparvus TaxID=41427 RepID=A0AAG5DL97_ANOAO